MRVCIIVSVCLRVLAHVYFQCLSFAVTCSLRTGRARVNTQPVNDSHLGILFTHLTGILKRSHCPLLSASQLLKLSIYSFSHVYSQSIFSSQKNLPFLFILSKIKSVGVFFFSFCQLVMTRPYMGTHLRISSV